jgi:hypothetical protein
LLSKTWKTVTNKRAPKAEISSSSNLQKAIFKFEDKIPAFSARLSVLITFFQVFEGTSFFICQKAY